jgi:hypothetical protein
MEGLSAGIPMPPICFSANNGAMAITIRQNYPNLDRITTSTQTGGLYINDYWTHCVTCLLNQEQYPSIPVANPAAPIDYYFYSL